MRFVRKRIVSLFLKCYHSRSTRSNVSSDIIVVGRNRTKRSGIVPFLLHAHLVPMPILAGTGIPVSWCSGRSQSIGMLKAGWLGVHQTIIIDVIFVVDIVVVVNIIIIIVVIIHQKRTQRRVENSIGFILRVLVGILVSIFMMSVVAVGRGNRGKTGGRPGAGLDESGNSILSVGIVGLYRSCSTVLVVLLLVLLLVVVMTSLTGQDGIAGCT